MTYIEERKIREDKALKLIEEMKKYGIFPITQHPDYQVDVAFDVDDIVEFLEKRKQK